MNRSSSSQRASIESSRASCWKENAFRGFSHHCRST